MRGKVVRLHKDLAIGSVVGPAFEAEISTESGEGVALFADAQGLELGDEQAEKAPDTLPTPPGKWLN